MNNKVILVIASIIVFQSCKTKKLGLNFLDEYILSDSLVYKGTKIGGLSGIDYDGELYHIVVDDAQDPRILKTRININDNAISGVYFEDVIQLKDTSDFYKENVLDLESILFDKEKQEYNLVSEGSINRGKAPTIFNIDAKANVTLQYELPEYFKTLAKHNASFESSTRAIDKEGIWVAKEGVLRGDGEEPNFKESFSPIRITHFNKEGKPTQQFAYILDKIEKPKKGDINLNGVTAILAYKANTFLVLERAYQSGYKSYGNTVRLYKVEVDSTTTNTLSIHNLETQNITPVKKELILDFKSIQSKLTEGIIDNIEGMTFGSQLSNGNRTLIFISDNNFNRYDNQLNQIIVFEVEE